LGSLRDSHEFAQETHERARALRFLALSYLPNFLFYRPLAQGDPIMAEIEIGKVTHFFSKAGVAAIQIAQDVLRIGDTIHIKGHTSDFTHKIDSMQIDNQQVAEAKAGQSIGVRVKEHAREHDLVYKVVP
jgi:hypothetical protein